MARTKVITYTGSQRAVIIQHPPGSATVVRRGEQVEMPADAAEGFLVQTDSWQEVKAAKPPKDAPKDQPEADAPTG